MKAGNNINCVFRVENRQQRRQAILGKKHVSDLGRKLIQCERIWHLWLKLKNNVKRNLDFDTSSRDRMTDERMPIAIHSLQKSIINLSTVYVHIDIYYWRDPHKHITSERLSDLLLAKLGSIMYRVLSTSKNQFYDSVWCNSSCNNIPLALDAQTRKTRTSNVRNKVLSILNS